ncbi:cytochrome c3 family protein [Nitrosophilus alvini]|uniref:cytochrome c3 family protein n=1 Tax=Nitrosophilus alvini TaxID=2714855 RepID=UPI00190CBFE7|nr:cytochrome c3 family protein [Nitrosophilus alvini]
MKKLSSICVLSVLLLALHLNAEPPALPDLEDSGGIYNTKHNLLSGIKLPKGEEKKELCIWCHIPHESYDSSYKSPLWLREAEEKMNFSPYGMEENTTHPGHTEEPDVMVRVCLTCHDGVNGPNISLFSESDQMLGYGFENQPTGGPDANNAHGHPIGVRYSPSSKKGKKANLRDESYVLKGWAGAKTISDLVSEGVVRCTSCHDPHSSNDQFLRTGNSRSSLCRGCHNK